MMSATMSVVFSEGQLRLRTARRLLSKVLGHGFEAEIGRGNAVEGLGSDRGAGVWP